jgi:hypothetical protein
MRRRSSAPGLRAELLSFGSSRERTALFPFPLLFCELRDLCALCVICAATPPQAAAAHHIAIVAAMSNPARLI